MKAFRRIDLWVILGFLLLAAGLWFFRAAPGEGALYAEIYYKDERIHRIALDAELSDQVIELGGAAIRVSGDGSVFFLHSDCPDQICVHGGKISADGQMLACVPNRLLVKIVSSDSGEGEKLRASFTGYFDTVSSVISVGMEEEAFSQFAKSLKRDLSELHGLYSIYDDSANEAGAKRVNLKAINDGGEGVYRVDPRLARMLYEAKRGYDLSEGKVNIALGKMLALWHTARLERKIPSSEALKTAAAGGDISKLIVHTEPGENGLFTVELQADLRLDAGAIAKGYALDMLCESYRDRYPGVSLLISLGGNIRAVGEKSDWRIGIQHPDGDGVFASFILPAGKAVATSGDYERYFELDGKRYHHIIDPQTYMPADYGIRSVTVVSDSGALSDLLTTALFMMPPEEGIKLAQRLGAEVFYILDSLQTVTSDGFPSRE